MELVELKINVFSDQLASASPAPGGGSVAALCGALASALCRMTANLTIGKKKYHAAEAAMKTVEKQAADLQSRLMELVDEDTMAYNNVVRAFGLPKATGMEKKKRTDAVQAALKQAAAVPLSTFEHAAAVLSLVETAVSQGNPNCITDAGVAAELVGCAAQGAAYNVFINLMDIKDPSFVSSTRSAVFQKLKTVQETIAGIRTVIAAKIEMEPLLHHEQ